MLVSAASVGALGGNAQAAPGPGGGPVTAGPDGAAATPATPAAIRARVDALYRRAETATQQYDGARQQVGAARAAVDGLQDELARKTARLDTTRDTLGAVAAAQYRSGTLDPTLQLALSSSPETYLAQAGALDRIGDRQAAALSRLAGERRDIEQTRTEANGRLAALKAAQGRLADRKRTVQSALHAAQALLASLTPAQRAAVDASDGSGGTARHSGGAATRGTSRARLDADPAPSARAARAVAFAYRAIGRPYVWGATGPGAYDCSGLTQAAWKAAGVSLPRTTYTQINAGTRVPRSALRPGDLVFFYSGVSHVGIYIGHGEMIHAPHPGAAVRIAPISEMPFAGATRPA
ncbi:putative NPL/P60 family secreted protein [Actinacidiphila reveromycinica]|uniref:Putative NPL/P60 family secreted protein n=1 Tax=Actinacidiphila reveromycinica TaxID=659352 RepID=A0A7U3VQC4_9ACTN|nr:putative NPL/P60 family secreted protein [Streptomyces sp. SN-593]